MDYAPLTEHSPRPSGDPEYVPWWAKGEYARKNGTKYTTESGVTIVAGVATGRVPTHLRRDPVLVPQPTRPSATETPRKAPATPARPARSPDAVAQLLATHRTRDARLALCTLHGVDPAIFTGAPNPGVAAMRLANALRVRLQPSGGA
jgi:hypothetical protein